MSEDAGVLHRRACHFPSLATCTTAGGTVVGFFSCCVYFILLPPGLVYFNQFNGIFFIMVLWSALVEANCAERKGINMLNP